MIEIFTHQEIDENLQTYLEVGRLRKRMFVDLLGWDVPTQGDCEFDFFDTLTPAYVVYKNKEGEVKGCCRMIPTMKPYMLEQIWPEYVDGPLPKSPEIWENTRLAIDQDMSQEEQSLAFSELNIAGLEWLMERGVKHTYMLTATFLAAKGMSGKFGIRLDRVGPEHDMAGIPHVAVRTEELTHEAIGRLREHSKIWWPLHERGIAA